MSAQQFRLPDVGEGLTEAEIVAWHVAVGDTVEVNQLLVEIETAKAVVELPSPFAGTVSELLAEVGQTVEVGKPIVSIAEAGETTAAPETPSGPAAADASNCPQAASGGGAEPDEPAPSVLVGYGPTEGRTGRRRRQRPAPVPAGDDVAANAAPAPAAADSNGTRVAATCAKPPVRKLAKDLGVDLATVTGSGPEGRITRDDVLSRSEPATATPESKAAANGVAPERAVFDAGKASQTRIPIKGVRKATAAAMVDSAFTAPHVTEFLTVDVTRSVSLVEKLKQSPAFEGARVTFLLLVARAITAAIREFPEINASWDGDAGEIVLHHQVNLGIAAATPRGLMVPNIKDAGALSLPRLAQELTALVRTARDGKSTPEDMSKGTITITNVGVFGVDSATPILNPGEAAILCLGAVRRTPWEHHGTVALRQTTQLALSFDHRLVDGELGSKVLARIGKILENPRWELLLT